MERQYEAQPLALKLLDRPLANPHLVVKRGHRGRYRFMMIHDGERIGGEVYVDARPSTPVEMHALALAKITRLVEALQVGVETRVALSRGSPTRTDPRGRVFDAGEVDSGLQKFPGAGDHHGEI